MAVAAILDSTKILITFLWIKLSSSSLAPWVCYPLVSTAWLTILFQPDRSCVALIIVGRSAPPHSLMSSNHSLLGLPLRLFPAMYPITTFFTILLSAILQICPKKFIFRSTILWTIFLVACTRFRTSLFEIFCCHLMFRIRL